MAKSKVKTIEDLRIEYRKRQEAKAKRQQEIAELEQKQKEALEIAQSSAERGDAASYSKWKAQAVQYEDAIYVAQVSATASEALDKEEVLAAWAEYEADLWKSIEAEFEKFKACEIALYEQLKKVADLQREGFATRQECLGFYDPKARPMDNDYSRKLRELKMSHITHDKIGSVIPFLLQDGIGNGGEVRKINRVFESMTV